MSRITDKGAKVTLKINGQWIAALVIDAAPASSNAYERVRLRIAVKSGLTDKWEIGDYPKPVQAYRLRRRDTTIPELDGAVPQPEREGMR